MTLLQLDLEQFRCIERAHLDFHSDANLIVGRNASGKTSLLEAIFFLGTGRSFRTHQAELLIRTEANSFLAVGKISGKQGSEVLGIRGARDSKEIRINGSPVNSLSELALRLPVQIIDPEVHRLVEDGPIRRRRFMDWGVFHVEHHFHDAWRRYQRALRQRNAALKAKQPAIALKVWDQELIEQGNRVADFRDTYIAALKPYVLELGRSLLGVEVELEHQRGWRRQADLALVLSESLQRDQQRGSTAAGPHRADLLLKINNIQAREHVSRGQQKMLACVLILAQQAHRVATSAPPACLLLDDPAAELDVDNLGKLLAEVAKIPTQLVVTALTTDLLNFFPNARLFHVEHGQVRAVA